MWGPRAPQGGYENYFKLKTFEIHQIHEEAFSELPGSVEQLISGIEAAMHPLLGAASLPGRNESTISITLLPGQKAGGAQYLPLHKQT